MAVTMRKAPTASGKDAERFIERVRMNNLAMQQRREERSRGRINDSNNKKVRQVKANS